MSPCVQSDTSMFERPDVPISTNYQSKDERIRILKRHLFLAPFSTPAVILYGKTVFESLP